MPDFTIFEDGTYPTTPKDIPIESFEDVSAALSNVHNHLKNLAGYQGEVSDALTSDFLVKGSQVESLGVDKLSAGTIAVDSIYLGSTRFELDGVNEQIIIQDESGTDRVKIGKFGSGTSYGIKAWDDSGDLILDIDGLGADVVGSVQIANGAINATAMMSGQIITDSLVATNAITSAKIQANAVTAAKINVSTLSAITITTGSLTVNGSTGITLSSGADITGNSGSEINVNGGANINMKASVSNDSAIDFFSTGGAEEATIIYLTSTRNLFISEKSTTGGLVEIQSTNGTVRIECGTGTGDEILIGGSTSQEIDINGRINQDVDPSADNAGIDLGSASLRWDHLFVAGTTVGDLRMGNGYIFTETNNMYEGARAYDGIGIISHKNRRLLYLDEEGNLYIRGEVRPMSEHKEKFKDYNRLNPVIYNAQVEALGEERRRRRELIDKLPRLERKVEQRRMQLEQKGFNKAECDAECKAYMKDLKKKDRQRRIEETAGYQRQQYENMMLEYTGGLVDH